MTMETPPPLPAAALTPRAVPPPLPASARAEAGFVAEVEKLGFTCSAALPGGVTFSGTLGGQTITGSFSPRTRTRYAGEVRYHTLSGYRLILETPVLTQGRMVLIHHSAGTRLTRWLNRKGNLKKITPPPALTTQEIWAADTAWAERLLCAPDITPHLAALVPDRSHTHKHSLQWHADKMVYSSFGDQDAQARLIADVLRSFAEVARLSATLPAATVPLVSSWWSLSVCSYSPSSFRFSLSSWRSSCPVVNP
jgi:hypothetical protein